MKIEIDNVFLIFYGQEDSIQSYIIEFDLMDNTIENIKEWEKQFKEIMDGRKMKLTLEDEAEFMPRLITWVDDFCYTCREMIWKHIK